jgi:hypothetical protein
MIGASGGIVQRRLDKNISESKPEVGENLEGPN